MLCTQPLQVFADEQTGNTDVMYVNLGLTFFVFGLIFGAVSVPGIYFWKKRRKFGKKHGFRRGMAAGIPQADASMLGHDKKEHSAEKF